MSSAAAAAGLEVLVFDADPKVVRGLETLLNRLGLVVTATPDPVRARDLLVNKFFTVALVDIDTPSSGGGLELAKFVRDKAPLTSVIVMVARKSFDAGVAAFRAGAKDVVAKEPDAVPYLRERVLGLAAELTTASEHNRLLEEIAEVHEEFLRRMRDISRQRVDLEDRLLGRDGGASGRGAETCRVLVADDDSDAPPLFARLLPDPDGWRVTTALTGGEALDFAAQVQPHIIMVKDQLPDLPGRMVVKTAKNAAPDAVTILYTPPIGPSRPGEVSMIDAGGGMIMLREYTKPEELAEPLREIREGIRQKLKERRYLQAFRQEQRDFLQRYNAVRQRIAEGLEKARR